jgi:hypothetical protein
MPTLTMGLFLGLLLGMRHAFEPDHLAAVSTMVARHRSPTAGALLGACWGLGHTVALLVVGGLLASVQGQLPDGLAVAFEVLVALMLIGLGLRALRQAIRLGPVGPFAVHRHGGALHAHPGTGDHLHLGAWTVARQPLLVGLVHGLAGSGAMAALVMTKMPTLGTRLSYMAMFGLGSIVGMMVLTGLAGWPLGRVARHPHCWRLVGSVDRARPAARITTR